MVRVGRMGVFVHQRCVAMQVRVRFGYRCVVMCVVLVMNMHVIVNQLGMHMGVAMLLAEQKYNSGGHQRSPDQLTHLRQLLEDRHRERRADEWGGGEISGLARGSQRSHRADGEIETESIAHGAQQ